MTTQPELPEPAPAPARPALSVAPAPAEPDVDFDAFVRAYERRLSRLVLRRIGDVSETEEITQETLLRAYQHRAAFVSEDELMAWSTVVAQRLVIDRLRVRGRSVTVPEVPEDARLGRDTAEIVVARHEARAALESLEAIPTRQAAVLWAREVEGLHYEEIAERFAITEPAVRSLLHRGRKALRKEFKHRTGSLPLNGLVPFAPWLLALKAAGKVRGAAKTVGRSSSATAAALSLGALVVTAGIGSLGAGRDPGRPEVRIEAGRHGATFVTAASAPDEPDRRAPAGPRNQAPSPVDTQVRGEKQARDRALPVPDWHTCVRAAGTCVVEGGNDLAPFSGGELQIGPDLPDNPAGLQSVRAASDYLDCSDVPDTELTECRQNGPAKSPVGITPAAPGPSEGARR